MADLLTSHQYGCPSKTTGLNPGQGAVFSTLLLGYPVSLVLTSDRLGVPYLYVELCELGLTGMILCH